MNQNATPYTATYILNQILACPKYQLPSAEQPNTSNSARFQHPDDRMGQKKCNDKKYDPRRRHDKRDQKNTSSARETKKARGPELKTKSSDIYKCLLKWQTLMNFLLLLTILSRHLSGSPPNRHQAGPTNSTYHLSKGAGGFSQDIRSTRFDIYEWWFLPFQNGNLMTLPSASIIPQEEREKWVVSPILISCFRKGSRAGSLRISGLNASIHINGGFCLTKMANPIAFSSASISPGSPQNRT